MMNPKLMIKWNLYVDPQSNLSGLEGRGGIGPKNYSLNAQYYVGSTNFHQDGNLSHRGRVNNKSYQSSSHS